MRKLVKAAAALTAGCMLLSTSAFAAADCAELAAGLQLDGGVAEFAVDYTTTGQSTILVLPKDVEPSAATDQNILYINQTEIVDGKASYKVNLGATFTGNADVWVGGTNEGTATKIGTLKGIVPITGVTISGTGVVDGAATLVEGDKLALTATVIPDDTTEDKTVTWSTDKADIATVNETTGEVVAVKAGTATITASTKNGKTATVVITVNAKAPSVDSVSLNDVATNLLLYKAGALSHGTKQLSATVIPATTEVDWKSSDETVATVNENGVVSAVGLGNVTITVIAGDKSASIDLAVIEGMYGDVSGETKEADEFIDALDAKEILLYDAWLESVLDSGVEKYLEAADVNNDGMIDAYDAKQILLYDAWLESELDRFGY